MRKALGGYAVQTPADTLTTNRRQAVPNDIARLRGSRLVFAAESEEGHRLSEAKIKSMTGGDRQVARFNFGEFFEFDPTLRYGFQPTTGRKFEGRRRYLASDQARAIQRPNSRGSTEPRPGIEARGGAEAVLSWAIEGALDYQRIGLAPPSAVEGPLREYRHGQDIIAAFFEEVCVTEPEATIKKSDLFQQYEAWCNRNNEDACTSRAFIQNLKERGIQEGRSKDARFWKGIRLSDQTVEQMVGVTNDAEHWKVNTSPSSIPRGTKKNGWKSVICHPDRPHPKFFSCRFVGAEGFLERAGGPALPRSPFSWTQKPLGGSEADCDEYPDAGNY
ncbi:MAG: hypothetical protein IPK00_10420 [Deltaproteobacteria bacterium]|nr:hypothetical protein [Deltaproteobacteria bacterium]